MKNRQQGLRVVLLFAVATTLLAGALLAQKAPAAKAAAAAPASGQASGTFAVGAKTFKLSHAAAFIDKKDKDKPTVIVITDDEVPAASWTSEFDMMRYRMDHKFAGVVFWLDAKHEVFRNEFYEKDGIPTATSGLFDLKLDEVKGKTISGSAHNTEAGEKREEPLKLDVRFSVTLK